MSFGSYRAALALVALVQDDADPGVVDPAEDLAGAVGAAVIDDDHFDLARERDVQRLLECFGKPRFLVVDGHQDGQLHDNTPWVRIDDFGSLRPGTPNQLPQGGNWRSVAEATHFVTAASCQSPAAAG
jgi:hypothetical protein